MFFSRLLSSLPAILLFIGTHSVSAYPKRHDASFLPDHVLYATSGNVTIDCESRYSVLLNGSSPGPALYLEEGKTSWIRVFNNIQDDNLTVVSFQ
jgi:L-ascorbate oxidase